MDFSYVVTTPDNEEPCKKCIHLVALAEIVFL